MKASELRIGNFLDRNGLMEVRVIAESEIKVHDHFNNLFHLKWFEVDFFKPIPITEEWLLKFGFEKTLINNGVIRQYFHDCTPPKYRNNYGLFFRFGEMRDEIYKMYWYASDPVNSNMHSFPCKYVHQLQNLYFALTGQELTFKK